MTIPSNFFLYINILIILIYLINCIIAYKNGLLLQLISLFYTFISIYICWLISPILANAFPLIEIDIAANFVNLAIIVNSFVYCLIIFIILKIIYWVISPLFKSVSKIPVLGFFNRIGGIIFGLINATILCLILSLLLNTPIINNSQEIRENTFFKYGETLTNKAMQLTVENINLEALKDKIDGFNVEETRNSLQTWLIEQGFINE